MVHENEQEERQRAWLNGCRAIVSYKNSLAKWTFRVIRTCSALQQRINGLTMFKTRMSQSQVHISLVLLCVLSMRLPLCTSISLPLRLSWAFTYTVWQVFHAYYTWQRHAQLMAWAIPVVKVVVDRIQDMHFTLCTALTCVHLLSAQLLDLL